MEVATLVPSHLERDCFLRPRKGLVPSRARMRDMLLQPGACNLVGALSFLGDALAHLDQHALPLFDRLTFASWTLKVACSKWWTGVAALLLFGATWPCCQWLGGPIRLAEALWWALLELAAQLRWSTHMWWGATLRLWLWLLRGACGLLACRGWRKSVWWSHLCRLCSAGSLAQCCRVPCASSRKRCEDTMVARWPRPQLNLPVLARRPPPPQERPPPPPQMPPPPPPLPSFPGWGQVGRALVWQLDRALCAQNPEMPLEKEHSRCLQVLKGLGRMMARHAVIHNDFTH